MGQTSHKLFGIVRDDVLASHCNDHDFVLSVTVGAARVNLLTTLHELMNSLPVERCPHIGIPPAPVLRASVKLCRRQLDLVHLPGSHRLGGWVLGRINSVYYGVDAFSPTLVDFYTVDQKRIVWSSRAHRKMMTTLYRAWHGKTWKVYSLSFWASLCGIVAFTLFITGATGEAIAHSARSSKASWGIEVHSSVDLPLLLASLFFLAYHAVTYLEVINCK
ncbi:hypothetical protein PC121_g20137 [Phytophthora cactorum]|nr:hypothetical protein PC121_g20137 [Phytophthora cactorum]KAG4064354.1 hypothetical protein PC123_g793 [Phytophthora cactorum]